MSNQQTVSAIDYDGLMKAHLYRVFAERDAEKRRAAIRELYAETVSVFEPDAEATGHDGIDHTVDAILSNAPALRAVGRTARCNRTGRGGDREW